MSYYRFKERNAKMLALRRQGFLLREIGERFGVSASMARVSIFKAETMEDMEKRHSVYGILSARTINCLSNMGVNIEDVDSLCALTRQELLGYRNFGSKCLNELEEYLATLERGLMQMPNGTPVIGKNGLIEAIGALKQKKQNLLDKLEKCEERLAALEELAAERRLDKECNQ
jgi:DNA-binding transcriptional MerR regulator